MAFDPRGGLLATVNLQGDSVSMYAVDAPEARIVSPADNQTFVRGQSAAASYSCIEANAGPGISSCTDANGGSGGSGLLDTASPGAHSYLVTATSAGGRSSTSTLHYTVVGPPTVQIGAPVDVGTYALDQVVPTSFTCLDDAGAALTSACTDSNGGSGSSGRLDTATAGAHTYTVTVTSSQGDAARTLHYTVVAMAAAISAPADNGTYTLGEDVPTSFGCGDASGAPATGSCIDSNGRSGGSGTLDTGTVGAHTYAVTATSASGQTLTRAIGYTVTSLAMVVPPTATAFTVTGLEVSSSKGRMTFSVTVPLPGTIRVVETASSGAERRTPAFGAKRRPAGSRPGSGRFVFAVTTRAVTGAGTVGLSVRPTTRGARLVSRHRHQVRVNLYVTFTPTGGTAHTVPRLGVVVAR